jgi:hypothetical protein
MLVVLAGCTSSLKVRPDSSGAEGIPFHLVEHSFVINDFGFNEDGKSVKTLGQKVDFVTRADPTRRFRILNDTAGFTDTEFSVVRDVQGGLTSITGGVTDRTFETIQALVSTVRTAAAFAALNKGLDETLTRKNLEYASLKALERALLDDLEAVSKTKQDSANLSGRAERIEKIEKALGLVRARLQEIKVAAEPKPGTMKSYSRLAPVDLIQQCRPADADHVQRLARASKTVGPDQVLVILVPADLPGQLTPCP